MHAHCPKCGTLVPVSSSILYRKPGEATQEAGPQVSQGLLGGDETARACAEHSATAPRQALPDRHQLRRQDEKLTATGTGPRPASLDVSRHADRALIAGALSFFFGWTFIVPLIGVCQYLAGSAKARAECLTLPVRAKTGRFLSLLFGISQIIMLISAAGKSSGAESAQNTLFCVVIAAVLGSFIAFFWWRDWKKANLS